MEIRLLGPLELSVGGAPVRLGRRQERLLLALLALHAGDVVTTTRIAEVLWDGEPPRTFANAIQVHVSALRRLLSREALETRPEGYRLRATAGWFDHRQFEADERRAARALGAGLLAEARQAAAEALALWRGPALHGLSGRYAEAQSARLEERRLAALERRIDLDLVLGGYSELVGELKGLLAGHPLHQGLTRRLMLALYGAGRPADALAAYREGRRLLVNELGIEPDDTLRLTQDAILRGERAGDLIAELLPPPAAVPPVPVPGSGATPVPRQLPADLAHFTGRAAHLDELGRSLSGDSEGTATVISTVTGTAGVGKTALALHWAHGARDRFPDGDLYVDLHGYAPVPGVSAAEALDACLRSLDVPPDRIPLTEDARTGLYRSLLDGRRMLIVLDNAASAEQVRPLLPGTPDCRVIVTSRSSLTGLAVGHGARQIPLGPLPLAEAVALLAEVIGGGPTSYLYRKLVLERGIAVNAGAWYMSSAMEDTRFCVYAVPAHGVSLEALEAAVDEVLKTISAEALDSDSIERAKTRLVAETIYSTDSQSSLARIYGSALAIGETIEDVRRWPTEIESVLKDDLASVAERYLIPRRSVTGYLKKPAA